MTLPTRDIVIHGDCRVPHLVFAVSRRTNLPSFMTRALTSGALWSHVAFFDTERAVMIEAVMYQGSLSRPWTLLPGGTVETPVDEWIGRYSEVEFFAVPVPNPVAGLVYARSRVGLKPRRDFLGRKRPLPKIPYDFKGASSAPWRGNWQNSDRDYCSEQGVVIVLHAGLVLFHDYNVVTHQRGVSPHEFWRAARAVGQVPRLELAA